MSENSENVEKQESPDDSTVGIFINPRTDFGFKKVFLDHEDALLSISNAVIYEESRTEGYIESITFQTAELLGTIEEERHAIGCAYCISTTIYSPVLVRA